MRVAVPGASIAVEERGSGLPLVFVHGGTGTAEVDWMPAVEQLSQRHRTVTMDMRAHGSSEDHAGPFGIVRFGLDAMRVMTVLGIPRAVLVGFSVGGNALLTTVARDSRRTLALVTIGSQMEGDPAYAGEIAEGPWPSYLTRIEHAVGDGPEYWRTLRNRLARDHGENLRLSPAQLATIACPALVCIGDADPIVTVDESRRLAEAIPGGELAVFAGAGHGVQLDRTDAFVEALEAFLSEKLSVTRRLASP